MCADAGLHANEARWLLARRVSTWPRDHFWRSTIRAALIVAYDMERVLADIDAEDGNGSWDGLGHGVLLVVSAPCQLLSQAGQEHGRTIPLADSACSPF